MKLKNFLHTAVAILIGTIVSVMPITLSAENRKDTARGERIIRECREALSLRRYDDLITLGESLCREGKDKANRDWEMIGKMMKIRGELCGHSGETHIKDIMTIEQEIEKDTTAGKKYDERFYYMLHTIGLYYFYEELNYSKSIDYAYKSLLCAESLKRKDLEADALNLLSSIYFLRQDSVGWQYALKSEEVAGDTNNYSVMYASNLNIANFLYSQEKFEEALRYLLKGKSVAEMYHLDSESSYIHSFLGDIYAELKDASLAEKYYKLSLEKNPEVSIYDHAYAKMRYASFLTNQGRVTEAIGLLQDAEKKIDGVIPNYYSALLLQLAENLEKAGRWKESLGYYKRHVVMQGELINSEKEKEIAILDLKYKVAEAENLNMRQSLELIRKKRDLVISIVIIFICIVITVLLSVLYRRTQHYYKKVVQSRLEALEKQKELEEQVQELLSLKDEDKEGPEISLTEIRAIELTNALRGLMQKERVYKQQDLSLEKLAQLLKTNRTYLSQVINEKFKCSYSTYINELRVNHAIELLSNASNTDNLKTVGFDSGFSTVANFYYQFKLKVGVSPAVFRKNACAQGQKNERKEE